MDTITDVETGAQIQSLLDRVERGEEVTITRQGKPVARLVPVSAPLDREQARTAAEGLLALSKGVRLDGISIRELIEEGRRY